MAHKEIEHFEEVRITADSLTKLPEDQKAIVSLLSFAVNEINILKNLYLFTAHDYVDQDLIDGLLLSREFLILRTWSAKLFEVEKCLTKIVNKRQTHDAKVLNLCQQALANFSSINGANTRPVYPIIRNIRNWVANHYSFDEAKQNLKHVTPSNNCKFYLHKMNGNSHYPIGDEVMFLGIMNRHCAGHGKRDAGDLMKSWMEWNLEADNWLATTHAKFTEELVFKNDASMTSRKVSCWIPPELVGTQDGQKAPILYRKAEK